MEPWVKYLLVFGCFLVLAETSSLDLNHVQNVLLRNKRFSESDTEPCNLYGKNDKLCFFTSKSAPYQIAVINSTANTAIVFDCIGKNAALIDGSKGHTIILNSLVKKGTYIAGSSIPIEYLFNTVENYKVTQTFDANKQNIFNFNPKGKVKTSSTNIMVEQLIMDIFKTLGKTFQNYAIKSIGSGPVVTGAMKLILEVESPIQLLIADIIDLSTNGWLMLKNDALDIWEIIKTFTLFTLRCSILKLNSRNVRIPLGIVIGKLNGLESFELIMSEIANKTTLVNTIAFMGKSPLISIRIIAGLGGMGLQDSTGVFTIVAKIAEQLLRNTLKTSSRIKDITDMVLLFFVERKKARIPVDQEIYEVTERLKKLFTQKNNKKKTLTPLIKMMDTMRGNRTLKLRNVNVAQAFKILTDSNVPDAVTMASSIIKIFTPLKIPKLINSALAGLFSSTVNLMNSEENRISVQEILPGISLPAEDGVVRSSGQTVPLLSLPTIEIIERVPQFRAVFAVLDRNAVQAFNISLYDTLKEDPHFNNEINIAIRRALA
ncbi:uncharacterized protein LOC115888377 [Sitophilus oryzae]|uniref:Uncharacterized protein LOC115888377 n=1 Tax=Sitophilus oryzae TaxID=7048 RepID=A0A6J2YLC3_SITOR|nr:uncharacterized protein LOC115888377 [Sitophilus oryzae]